MDSTHLLIVNPREAVLRLVKAGHMSKGLGAMTFTIVLTKDIKLMLGEKYFNAKVVERQDQEAQLDPINKNIADIVPASETESGIIEIATQAEVDAGTDDTRAITPLKLKTRLDAFDISDTYSQTFGNGVLQTFTITHNLNSSDVHVVVREVASGMRVEVQWVVSSVNVITIGTNSVPLSNFYRVTVKK